MNLNEAKEILKDNGYMVEGKLSDYVDELDAIENGISNLELYIDKSFKELHNIKRISEKRKDKKLITLIDKSIKAYYTYTSKIAELRNEFDYG